MVTLKDFFAKHKPEFSLMTAMKMVEKKMEKAKKEFKEHSGKEGEEKCYLKAMAEAYVMLEDIFDEMGVDPSALE